MTTWFVNSGASGANNGTSKTDAWTSIASAASVAAGDEVRVHKTHAESLAANVNFANGAFANPVRIICIDFADDSLQTSAVISFSVTNTGLFGNVYVRGVTQSGITSATAIVRVRPPNDGRSTFENCGFSSTGTGGLQIGSGAEGRMRVDFINCAVDFSGASNASVVLLLNSGSNGNFNWFGGTFICRATQTNLITLGTTPLNSTFRGVNFNGTVTNVFSSAANSGGAHRFDGCSIGGYTNVFSTLPLNSSCRANLDGLRSGALTAALLRPSMQQDAFSALQATASVYRSGGADLYAQPNSLSLTLPYSWQIVSTANVGVLLTPFETAQLGFLVSAGVQTLTFYVASGVTLKDDELWIEVFSPSEAVSPTSQFAYRSTRALPLAIPAPLTTDSASTWIGSTGGVFQKISIAIAPTVDGVCLVHFNLAKPTTTVYVDPKAVI